MNNFGYDCRNNLDNCKFEPICDKINEISYIRKYHKNLLDVEVSPFINSRLLEDEISERFNDEMQKIKKDDPFRDAKIQQNTTYNDQEALEQFKKRKNNPEKKDQLLTMRLGWRKLTKIVK